MQNANCGELTETATLPNSIYEQELESKDQKIQDLEKQIRVQAFESKSQLAELQREVIHYKASLQEYETKANLAEENMKIIMELESKLSESESVILKMREHELDMKKELANAKNELMATKSDHKSIQGRSSLERKSLLFNSRKPGSEVNTALNEKIHELQNELENRDKMISQLKESYLETVLEKERTIYDLQSRVQDTERDELQKVIQNLERKVLIIEEELEKAQNSLVVEKDKNERDIVSKLNQNMKLIIDGKAKETEIFMEKIREQDEKESELSKRVIELESSFRKTQNELKITNSKFEGVQNEKNSFLRRICELEAEIANKNRELTVLSSKMTSQAVVFEKERNELLLNEEKVRENLAQVTSEHKKQAAIINELKSHNVILKTKSSELSDIIEKNQQKHEQEVKSLLERYEESSQMQPKQSLYQKTSPKLLPSSIHKRTLSQELGNSSSDHIFSFVENSATRSPKQIETKIKFSVCLNEDENLVAEVQKQRKSIIEQTGNLNLATEMLYLKEERLSTVEDKENESPLKEVSLVSSVPELEELKLEIEQLENEKKELLAENMSLKKEIQENSEKFTKEMECSHKRESQITNDMQKYRKESLQTLKEASLVSTLPEMEELKLQLEQSKNEIKQLKLGSEQLENEKNLLLAENLSLKNDLKENIVKLEKEMESSYKREIHITNEKQEKRKESLVTLKEASFVSSVPEIEELKLEIKQLENVKNQLLGENLSLKNEMKEKIEKLTKEMENSHKMVSQITDEKQKFSSVSEMEELKFEVAKRKNEKNEFLAENMTLKKEIERSQKSESPIANDLQKQRKASLLTPKEASLASSVPEIEELKLEIEQLENEKNELLAENMDLKKEMKENSEKFAKELECSHKRESQITNDMQKHRKESLLMLQSNNNEISVKFLQSEIQRLENLMKVTEDQHREEKKFWEGEVKEVENKAIEAKLKYAQIMTEKDILELRCRQLMGQRETVPNISGKKLQRDKTFFDFLFCND